MAVHIWCPRPSDSAIALRDALRAAGITTHKTKPRMTERHHRHFLERAKPGDLWINWGQPHTPWDIKSLNGADYRDKREQLIQLYKCGVPCPEVFDEPGDGRLGRSFRHQGGSDLRSGRGRDYYTQRLDVAKEFRIHVFKGKSIRAGVKVPRTDSELAPHPWIRTYDAGWRISYKQEHNTITNDHRDLAKRAVAALGLDFGAVDVAAVRGGGLAVLEVNLAPGLEGGTVDAYKRHIIAAINE